MYLYTPIFDIYVGNLSFDVSGAQLRESFVAFGTVNKANVITDRDTGRSRGFGFVEMANDDEANAAIEGLNGTELGGRQITVNVAKPRVDRNRNGGGRDHRDGDAAEEATDGRHVSPLVAQSTPETRAREETSV